MTSGVGVTVTHPKQLTGTAVVTQDPFIKLKSQFY